MKSVIKSVKNMSSVFRLLFLSLMVMIFMVYVNADNIIDSEEIEMLQKKLCDENLSKESKDLMIDCMEENLPFVLLEAMDSCIYETIPNAFTRDEIQKSLCKSQKIRSKVHSCMQRKQKELETITSKEEMMEKFKNYKNCVDSALNKKKE